MNRSEQSLAVGISDLLAHRECPRRAKYGARRHIGEGVQNHGLMTPEAGSPATWYGSAIHDVIEASEEGLSDDAAIELAWSRWGAHLDPEDHALLKEDLAKFHERDFQGVRTVLSEGEIRVPLTHMPDGRPIFFRGRIDRLYERLDQPGSFIHVDYKSSKWLKTQDEIDKDLQLWAYNWSLYEYFPEIEELEQWMDQLRGGMVSTRKSDEQRVEIHEWLSIEARSYFTEVEPQSDGLPAPRFNQWCPWCPILESCEIVPRLSDWARARIDTLAPPGSDGDGLESGTPIDEYMGRYDDAQTAIKTLERYVDSVKQLVRQSPEGTRSRLGFKLGERRNPVIDVRAREALYETLGHRRFLELAGINKKALESLEDEEQREWALSLVDMVPGSKVVQRSRR